MHGSVLYSTKKRGACKLCEHDEQEQQSHDFHTLIQ